MTGFIVAVNSRNGKQRIPAHWLEHELIGRSFRLPASAKRRRALKEIPDVAAPVEVVAATNVELEKEHP